MSEGEISEFDKPYLLLQNEDSLLYKMVEQTGKTESANLLDIAHRSYLNVDQDNTGNRK